MTDNNLTDTDKAIIRAIERKPGMASPDIGRAVGLSMAAASTRLTRLASIGAVDRKQDPNSGKQARYLYYPLQATGQQAQGSPLPPSAVPKAKGTVRAIPETLRAQPVETPAKPTDIESAIVNLTGLIADRIMTGVSQVVVDRLADSIVDRVTQRIGERMATEVTASVDRADGTALFNVEQRITAAFAGAQRVETQQKFVPAKRPRVLIIGLTDAQFSEIENEFGKEFDFRHVDSTSTRNPATWKDKVANSQYIIMMTKFISHSAHDVLGGKKPIMVNGGMSDLRNHLTELYVEITK
jgi:hypothetical protein